MKLPSGAEITIEQNHYCSSLLGNSGAWDSVVTGQKHLGQSDQKNGPKYKYTDTTGTSFLGVEEIIHNVGVTNFFETDAILRILKIIWLGF